MRHKTSDISVIIPVYNVEAFIDECLQSVVAQTLRPREVLIVNDGTPDNSREICRRYAEEHDWITIIDQENKGLSEARNTGIDHASGRYIVFIDSDDYIAPDMLAILHNKARETGADMVKCGTISFTDMASGRKFEYWRGLDSTAKPSELALNTRRDFFRAFFEKKLIANVWNAIYRTELFHMLRFPPGKIMEDNFITPQLLIRCKQIVIITDSLYYYRQRPGAIMHSFDDRHFDIIESDLQLKRILIRNSLFDDFDDSFYRWYGFHLLVMMRNAARYNGFFQFRRYARKFHTMVTNEDIEQILKTPDNLPVASATKRKLREFRDRPSLFWLKLKIDTFKKARRQ